MLVLFSLEGFRSIFLFCSQGTSDKCRSD